MRLKSRTKFPPGQFQILLPEIGHKRAIKGSFNEVVDAFSKIVLANPALAQKHNWPTDRASQEDWIDEREARRMLANGWTSFVDLESAGELASFPKARPARSGLLGKGESAAGKLSDAAAIYRDLLGPDGRAVPQAQAEARAAICLTCAANDRENSLARYFVAATAKALMGVFGLLKGRNLQTSVDDHLGTCVACSCPLRAKVWPEISIIKAHQSEDTWIELRKANPDCWQLREAAGSPASQ